MRKSLLATVAAAALAAGTVAVSAQGMSGGGAGTGAGGPPSAAPAPSTAPAEKMDKAGPSGGARSQSDHGRSTTGQGSPGAGSQMDRGSSGQSQMDRTPSQPNAGQTERGQRGQTEMNRDQGQPPRTGQSGQSGSQQTGRSESTATSTALSTEQRTKIRETVLKGGSVNRVSKVNFKINVGTVVPRSVHLVAVPSTIVEVHPAWRGYMYFVVDDEIIIVEPSTLKIVAVIT